MLVNKLTGLLCLTMCCCIGFMLGADVLGVAVRGSRSFSKVPVHLSAFTWPWKKKRCM